MGDNLAVTVLLKIMGVRLIQLAVEHLLVSCFTLSFIGTCSG